MQFSSALRMSKEARLNKPQKGHLKKAGDSLKKYLKEFRFEDCTMFQLGDVVKADMFVEGDFVDVTGTYQGPGLRRRHQALRRFAVLKETHGGGPVHRHAGSMGSCSDPSQYLQGQNRCLVTWVLSRSPFRTLDVVKVDAELNLHRCPRRRPRPQGRHRLHQEHR